VRAGKLVLHVDGGARGNPGPAAIGVVIADIDGRVIEELAEPIGTATNNVAEYRALLRGIERAAARGASEIEVINDSELVARQLNGVYKVKHPAMRPLYLEALERLLGSLGIAVLTATTSPANAVDVLRERCPDLLVVGMEARDDEFDGLSLMREASAEESLWFDATTEKSRIWIPIHLE